MVPVHVGCLICEPGLWVSLYPCGTRLWVSLYPCEPLLSWFGMGVPPEHLLTYFCVSRIWARPGTQQLRQIFKDLRKERTS